jgi:hypothetical protein
MWHGVRLAREFFAKLAEVDEEIARQVAAARCRYCGGPLHQGNYRRKPRGAEVAGVGEAFKVRHSLCCGRRGCRRRALPPSLRFLGRRVYLEAVVLIATALTLVMPGLRQVSGETGVPVRTLRRWQTWWTTTFPRLSTWTVLRARFAPPPPEETGLPKSLLDRFAASLPDATASEVLALAARSLAPLTTGSVPDGSRFVYAALGR